MNVESANVSPLLPTSSGVEGASLPLTEDGAIPTGFSESLLAQIELLMGVTEESQSSLQAQAVTDSQSTNLQDIAGLVGKDLPVTDAVNDADNLSATLDAVTDTLKYIAAGKTAEEKAAEAEQNMKDVVVLAAETEQNMKDVVALAAETEQNMKDVVAEAEQSMKDMLPANDAPVQTDASLVNGDLDKEAKNKDQEQDQVAPAEDISVQEEPAAIVLPPVVLTEQAKTDNKAAQDDAAKEKVLSSFVKPFTFTEGVKLSLSQQKNEVSGDGSQQEADVHQSTQDKQNFNLKFFENAGRMGKTGQIEHQPLGLEADKVAARAAGDIAQLNRPIADNKVDVPALAKPLSHPEWNKDLGDRIVWMNNRAIPTAEIKMNPQHLGPISVRIDVNQDHQANIVFTAQHAVVREAIEASIPKLREMMGAQQLDLVNVNISQNSTSGQGQPQSFAQMADGGSRGKSAEGVIADGISDAMEDAENGQAVVSKGLLSIYA
jgi:flagellar hook-length control protein FliK